MKSQMAVRRTISLICAFALIVVGAYFFVDLPLRALHPEGIIVVAAGGGIATFLGLYWLWTDFIKADRGRRNK
jgi:hypothetical protein